MARRGGTEAERRLRGVETRAALIAAARELFATRGYYDTGAEDLVAAAGVGTRGAFYHHFADKKDLFAAAFKQVEQDLSDRIEGADPTADPWDRLVNGLQTFLGAALEPEVHRIILIDGPAVLGWDIRRRIEGPTTFKLMEAVVQEAIENSGKAPQPVPALAHLIIAAVEEAALLIAHSPDPEQARRDTTAALGLLLEGLRAGSPDPSGPPALFDAKAG